MPYIVQTDRKRLEQHIEQICYRVRENIPIDVTNLVDEIAWMADQQGYIGAYAGLLNYTLTEIALRTLDQVRYYHICGITSTIEGMLHEYHEISELTTLLTLVISSYTSRLVRILHYPTEADYIKGVLRNVSQEFYRRLAIPYEDLQIAKSGDVSYTKFNYVLKIEDKNK